MRECDHCKIQFEPTRHWQRFHSTKCRSAWHDLHGPWKRGGKQREWREQLAAQRELASRD